MCIAVVRNDYCPWMWEKCRRFSFLGMQLGVLSLDAIFFAGKISSKIPEYITRASLTSLSVVGSLSLPTVVDLLYKTIRDALCGYNSKNTAVMIIAACKVIEIAGNLGLFAGGFAASIMGLFGAEALQGATYKTMMPISEVGIALSLALIAAYYVMNKRAKSLISVEILDELKECHDNPAAANLRLCMDKDTLGHLIKNLILIPEDERGELLQVIEENIQTQIDYAQKAQLVLTLLNYLLLAIQRYFTINSVQGAAINLGAESLYCIKLLVELLKEVNQRHQITQIAFVGKEGMNLVEITPFSDEVR